MNKRERLFARLESAIKRACNRLTQKQQRVVIVSLFTAFTVSTLCSLSHSLQGLMKDGNCQDTLDFGTIHSPDIIHKNNRTDTINFNNYGTGQSE